MTTRNWKIPAYWAATGLFSGLMLLSAGMYLAGTPQIREGISHLGYPQYLLVILGTAKLLGAMALIQRRLLTLREWAYAGFTFDLLGATASHIFVGDPLGTSLIPVAFLVPLAMSYLLRPERHPTAREVLSDRSPVMA